MAKTEISRPQTANIPPFGLRMQPDLKERIEAEARSSGRSVNAEIVIRLERSLSNQEHAGAAYTESALERLKYRDLARFVDIISAVTLEMYDRLPDDEKANRFFRASVRMINLLISSLDQPAAEHISNFLRGVDDPLTAASIRNAFDSLDHALHRVSQVPVKKQVVGNLGGKGESAYDSIRLSRSARAPDVKSDKGPIGSPFDRKPKP